VSECHYYYDTDQNHNSIWIGNYFVSYLMYILEIVFVNIFVHI